MIDSIYYFQNTYTQTPSQDVEPKVKAFRVKAELKFFINGIEVQGSNFRFNEHSKKVRIQKESINPGDIIEIVRNVPTLQPYQILEEDVLDSEVVYFQTAVLRLLMESFK